VFLLLCARLDALVSGISTEDKSKQKLLLETNHCVRRWPHIYGGHQRRRLILRNWL